MKRLFSLCLKFLLPVGIWLWIFRAVLLTRVTVAPETFTVYSAVKFFWDSLSSGEFPLWNPFVMLGQPLQILLSLFGATNPLWLVGLLLRSAGVAEYAAFVWVLVGYHVFGLAGFFLLARRVLADARAAYLAFLLLLFSSASLIFFPQCLSLLIYVPGIWFFYFLVRFYQDGSRSAFVGLCAALVIIACSYLPFYFLTVSLCVLVAGGVVFPGIVRRLAVRIGRFAVTNPVLVSCCLAAVVLSLWPEAQAYRLLSSGQVAAPMRGQGAAASQGGGTVDLGQFMLDGGLSAQMSLADLYAHLDEAGFGHEGFFYLPLFCYILLLLGLGNRVTRCGVFFTGVSLLLLLVMLRSSVPFNAFLFRQVFWFRLFRNVVLLLPFFFSAVALLAAEQARLLLQRLPLPRAGRWRALLWIVAVHGGLWVFLSRQEAVIRWSFLALLASGLVLSVAVFYPRWLGARSLFLPVLLLIVIVTQAAPVFHSYASLVDERPVIQRAVRAGRARPAFSYLRLAQSLGPETQENRHLFYSWHRITMTDASFFDTQGFSTSWMYALQEKSAAGDLQRYFRNKFVVYDRVTAYAADQEPDPATLAAVLADQSAALVAVSAGEPAPQDNVAGDDRPAAVTRVAGPAEGVVVKDFGVNHLDCETHFARPVFLVYNDAYHPDWRAWVNGRPSRVYRANTAFKGVALPAGSNAVSWAFCPAGGGWMYVLVLLANSVLVMGVGVWSFMERRRPVSIPAVGDRDG